MYIYSMRFIQDYIANDLSGIYFSYSNISISNVNLKVRSIHWALK